MASIKIILVGIFGLIAFFWLTGMSTDLMATQLDDNDILKPVLNEWSKHSMIISLLLIGILIISSLLLKSIPLTVISLGLIIASVWIIW